MPNTCSRPLSAILKTLITPERTTNNPWHGSPSANRSSSLDRSRRLQWLASNSISFAGRTAKKATRRKVSMGSRVDISLILSCPATAGKCSEDWVVSQFGDSSHSSFVIPAKLVLHKGGGRGITPATKVFFAPVPERCSGLRMDSRLRGNDGGESQKNIKLKHHRRPSIGVRGLYTKLARKPPSMLITDIGFIFKYFRK